MSWAIGWGRGNVEKITHPTRRAAILDYLRRLDKELELADDDFVMKHWPSMKKNHNLRTVHTK